MSGHFDDVANAHLTGEIAEMGTVGIPVNLGVGVVTPVESIIELLDSEDVVADRRRREQE